jgi:hypothetical protein
VSHTSYPFTVDSWADLARAISVLDAAGALGMAHLCRALKEGRIAFLPTLPDTSTTKFKDWVRTTTGRAAIALVGDDDGMDRGPAGWPIAQRAVDWSRSILIHAAGAEIAHYETAIIAAALVHRMLIIECGSATVDEWIELVRASKHGPSTLVILPRHGVHPVSEDRSKMQ